MGEARGRTEYKMKAKITKVGIVKDGVAMLWEFDGEGKNISLTDGTVGGWTIEELAEISRE